MIFEKIQNTNGALQAARKWAMILLPCMRGYYLFKESGQLPYTRIVISGDSVIGAGILLLIAAFSGSRSPNDLFTLSGMGIGVFIANKVSVD